MSESYSSKIRNMSIVCAMLVAFIHVGRPSVVGSSGWWIYQFTAEGISRIAVPFFFVCSGYFLAGHFSENGWYVSELRKRTTTLLLPYLIWSLFFYMFIYVLYTISPDNPICWRMRQEIPTISRILQAIGLSFEKLPMLYPLWYVRFLFLLVVLSPFLVWGTKHLKNVLFIGVAILYFVFNSGDGSPVGLHIGFPFEGTLYFYCGILLHDEMVKGFLNNILSNMKGIRIFVIWCAVLSLIMFRAVLVRNGAGFIFLKPLFIPIGIVAVWSIIPNVAWPHRFVSLSFLVYVTHVFGLQLFSFMFGRDSDVALKLLGRVCFGLCFALGVSHLLKNVIGNRVGVLWGAGDRLTVGLRMIGNLLLQ